MHDLREAYSYEYGQLFILRGAFFESSDTGCVREKSAGAHSFCHQNIAITCFCSCRGVLNFVHTCPTTTVILLPRCYSEAPTCIDEGIVFLVGRGGSKGKQIAGGSGVRHNLSSSYLLAAGEFLTRYNTLAGS